MLKMRVKASIIQVHGRLIRLDILNLILAESLSHFIVFKQALIYMKKSGGSTCAYKPVPVARLIADPGMPRPYSFVEIDHEIFSTVILLIPGCCQLH